MASVCACGDYFTLSPEGELCLIPGSTGLRGLRLYNEPGVYQFTASDFPWLARVRVTVQAGGGGSAGATAAENQLVARPGGAGGGWSQSFLEVDVLGGVESVVVGAGGGGGAGNSEGSRGGNSSFGGFVLAEGGAGGGLGMGSGTSAETVSGTPGAMPGTGQITVGGGPGGGAIRINGVTGLSGAGGDSHMGGGGQPRSNPVSGNPPRGYGAGAGGALAVNTSVDGGPGGPGIVIVELFG